MRPLRWLLPVLALIAATPALAVQPDEMLANPVLEARARAISQELRCMVCQNESIDNSQAPLARDIRLLVRARLKAGDTDKQVIDFLVGRYGDFVLLKPPFEWNTLLLWLVSPLLLVAGGLGLWLTRRRMQGDGAAAPPLTAAEKERLRTLLGPDEMAPSTGSRAPNV